VRHFTCAILALALAAPVLAQTSYPMISHTIPVAVERGKTTEVLVEGQMDFFGAYQVLFDHPGLRAEVVTSPAGKGTPARTRTNKVKLKVTVERDVVPGVHDFRVVSSLGVSSTGQLAIVDAPVVAETSVNNTLAQAQALTLPCVVAGRLEAIEDVDYFKCEARAGEHLTFEVVCARLQDRIHDLQKHAKPMLTLYDADGRELAANDHFYFADPMLSFTVPRTGTYYLQIRDSTYDGDARWVYALLATNRPYASHVYPMAGNPGRTIEVEPVGSAKAFAPRVRLPVPAAEGPARVPLDVQGTKTNPITFLASPLSQFLEAEPNDEPAQATRVSVPGGINGRIARPRDLDHFVFAAKKGKTIVFEMHARRFASIFNSTLHGVLEIMDKKGNILSSNELTHQMREASLGFTPAADGDYILRVRDLNSKGSDSAVYFISADWAKPDFLLRCDPDKAMIGPGSSAAWYVQVERRHGFAGPVTVEVKNLPPGVHASPLTIPASMTQGLVVVTADANAKRAAANVMVIGTAVIKTPDGKDTKLVRRALPEEEIYLPGGGRGRMEVALQTVAVTDPSDILKVNVSATKIALKPGQEAKIDVTIERRPDYNKDVSLDVVLQHLGSVYGSPLPPGVKVVESKSKTLLGKSSAGHIVLKAADNAQPVDNVPISVVANVSINFVVKVAYSSPPIWITVQKK
jgi:hypothetical protein